MEDLEGLLQHLRPLADLGKREPVPPVLVRMPARAEANLDAPTAQLVGGEDDLGEVAGRPEGHRRDEHPQPDPRHVPRQPGDHRPGVRGVAAGLAGEALVVVRAEQRLEPGGLGPARDGQLVVVGQPHLGLDHEGEAHAGSSVRNGLFELTG